VLATHRQGLTRVTLATLATLALPSTRASAEPKPEIGFRSGYAVPFGKIYERHDRPDDLRHFASGQVPVWFDIGARISDKLFVGGYFQYGVVVFSDALERECVDLEQRKATADEAVVADCSFHDLRLGAQIQFHFGKPGLRLDPWVGGGVGYEWLSLGMFYQGGGSATDGDLSETLHGFEFMNLQSGLDLRMSDSTAFGPFVALTLSTYRIARSSCDGDCGDWDHEWTSIDDEVFHQWLYFGIRGSFKL
jgi:hypothetical protein